jgi:hypothetical protein
MVLGCFSGVSPLSGTLLSLGLNLRCGRSWTHVWSCIIWSYQYSRKVHTCV